MIGALRQLWAHHRVLLAALVLAIAVMLFFAVRLAVMTLHFADPAHRDQPIEGWMTPRYVAHSWHLPPEIVRETLALDSVAAGRRQSLSALAAERGIPLEDLTTALDAAIADHRAGAR